LCLDVGVVKVMGGECEDLIDEWKWQRVQVGLYISVHIRAHADSPLGRTRDVHETSRPYSDGWTLHSILYLGHVESSRKQEPVQRACIPNNHSAITPSRAKHLRIQHCISARVGPNSTKEILGRLLRVSGQEDDYQNQGECQGRSYEGKESDDREADSTQGRSWESVESLPDKVQQGSVGGQRWKDKGVSTTDSHVVP
jgi:hypothetical protein